MKIGICVYTNDPESVWNAFRFGNYSIKHSQDEVRVFLLGKGVEAEMLDTDNFKVTEQMRTFIRLPVWQAGEVVSCPVSTGTIREPRRMFQSRTRTSTPARGAIVLRQ